MARRPQKKAPPKNLTVREAKRLGLHADRDRLTQERIAREAEDEALKELGRQKAAAKVAAREAKAAARKAEKLANDRERSVAKAADQVVVLPETAQGQARARTNRLRELIEPQTEAMVNVMISIAKDEKVHPSIRMECADRVLSRAYGKPKEHVEISDPADSAGQTDEMLTLLGNIFEAVGLPPLLEGPIADGPVGDRQGPREQALEEPSA